ncbi:hypothetical protein FZ983_27340 [Azospirillum sp. B21]|uniref:hypothetical protein n=1 Tax=Azospirillum sp. B21 TaxID=2607496 RepID=UPI0011EBDAFB|nr:hypothetical protein [Azospirillum sp. B21]KAA0574617.1 hypothetical protein FZ983_27340 [Azospirillum sp. B21]
MSAPVPNDTVSFPVPDFVGHSKGLNGGVQVGNLELIEFSPLMRHLDPQGELRQRIVDALNATPGLSVRFLHAAFSRAPATAANQSPPA